MAYSEETLAKYEAVKNELVGTCDNRLESVAESHGINPDDMDFLEWVDDNFFECVVCGWFYDIDDMGDNETECVCADCHAEDEG